MRETVAGCQRLKEEWARYDLPLEPNPAWDVNDYFDFLSLTGQYPLVRRPVPGPTCLYVPSTAILEYRKVKRRYDYNVNFPWRMNVAEKYGPGKKEQEVDEKRLPDMAIASEEGRLALLAFRAEQVADLDRRIEELAPKEARDMAEVTQRAVFDGSDRGRLMGRYMNERMKTSWGMFCRLQASARESRRESQKLAAAQVAAQQATPAPAASSPSRSRSEANSRVEPQAANPARSPQPKRRDVRQARPGRSRASKNE